VRKILVQKGAASDFIARKQKKRGSNHVDPPQTALTSMLETVKIGVWETPERLDAMRFSPHGI